MVAYALISVLRRLGQKDREFKASLDYIMRCCPEKLKKKKDRGLQHRDPKLF